MSASPCRPALSSRGVDQTFSKDTTTISHQANGLKRRKKRKLKHYAVELHEMTRGEHDQRRGKKRKSDDENECFSPTDVLDSLLEQTNHLQIKRSRNDRQTEGEAKSVALLSDSWDTDSGFSSEISPAASGRSSPCVGMEHSQIVALDCEMVGTGPGGQCSEVARCSVVNYNGSVIYDKYILPQQAVTNYRTRWSGIRKHHLAQAVSFEEAQNEIVEILKGKVLVGHSLCNDFKVLDISVPAHMVRDTCCSNLLQKLYGASDRRNISLKKLSLKLLGRNIQVGRAGHSSVEDARAALDLYKMVEDQWEKDLSQDSTEQTSDSLQHYMQDQYWPDSVMDCSL